ncbi:hypothetical protein IH992_28430 [Candidatus Poribacteria bacterium]|nr:hypothetical protein [Candidatus Poribacteria bacterium]
MTTNRRIYRIFALGLYGPNPSGGRKNLAQNGAQTSRTFSIRPPKEFA